MYYIYIGNYCIVTDEEGSSRVDSYYCCMGMQDTRDSRLGGQERRKRVTFADRLLAGEREHILPTFTVLRLLSSFFSVLTELNLKRKYLTDSIPI